MAFVDFDLLAGSYVGEKNGAERAKCHPGVARRPREEVHRDSQEPAQTRGSAQEKTPTENGWGFVIGGGGGNRTRVRKPSTDSSTYLAWPIEFNPVSAGRRADNRRVT